MSAGTINAARLLISPASLKRMKRGTQMAVRGTIRQPTERTRNRVRHVPENCEIAKPAIEANTIVAGTATAATMSELAMYRSSSTNRKIERKLLHATGDGMRSIVRGEGTPVSRNDADTADRSGRRKMNATNAASRRSA